jgi:hypothetical protein
MTERDVATLRDIACEIQELVAVCSAHGDRIVAPDVARLGLALADLTRALPTIQPAEHQYFEMVESLARAALTSLTLKEKHEC